MRISDWSSDVCSSDLSGSSTAKGETYPYAPMVAPFAADHVLFEDVALASTFEKGTVADSVATGFGKVSNQVLAHRPAAGRNDEIGRASCRERVCQYV